MFDNVLYYEIDNADLIKNGKKACIDSGKYTAWTQRRIAGAFSFGRGTEKDLKRYARDNRQYCAIFSAGSLERI